MQNQGIDNGRAIDWGCASADYAKYRDIYPDQLYERFFKWALAKRGSIF